MGRFPAKLGPKTHLTKSGSNNVVDGLLRFKEQRTNVELIGFYNGATGLIIEDFVEMTRENFKYFVNLGGIDYIGRGPVSLR